MTNISDLDVVGYATVLIDGFVPAVVAPVFRRKGSTTAYLFPPFRLIGDYVDGGVWDTVQCWHNLLDRRQMTALDDPISAGADYELWIDEDMKPHYELRRTAIKELQALSKQYLDRARNALAIRDIESASRFSDMAFNADDGQLDPLTINAAIAKFRGDIQEVEYLASLAESFCGREAFVASTDVYYGWLGKTSPVHGVAGQRPAELSNQLFPTAT